MSVAGRPTPDRLAIEYSFARRLSITFGVPRLRGSDRSFPPEGGTPNKKDRRPTSASGVDSPEDTALRIPGRLWPLEGGLGAKRAIIGGQKP